jgi:hypothetical protein
MSSHFSHTMNVLLLKFLYNIFIGVRIIKEIPGSLASGTLCIIILHQHVAVTRRSFLGLSRVSHLIYNVLHQSNTRQSSSVRQ